MADLEAAAKRWMALDVGSKTIGVAVSDPLKLTARPLLTLSRKGLRGDCRAILEVARAENVEKIIVGRPLHLDGSSGDTLKLVEELVQELARQSSLPIEWMDERLSTREAEALAAQAGLGLRERRARRNEFAAAVILQRYLEERT